LGNNSGQAKGAGMSQRRMTHIILSRFADRLISDLLVVEQQNRSGNGGSPIPVMPWHETGTHRELAPAGVISAVG
jgi:hypothetical protein